LNEDFILDLYRLRLPPVNEGRAGWKFDNEAILAAIDELEIKLPVVLRFRHYKKHYNTGWRTYGKHGMHQDYNMGTYHEIKINDALTWKHKDGEDITLDRVSWIIWHELKHAEQTERWAEYNQKSPFRFYHEAYNTYHAKGRWGATYAENIYEVDANDFADRKIGQRLAKEIN
jgi:hypothetical protein